MAITSQRKLLGTGKSSLSRSDVVKRIWECIKQNNLQLLVACANKGRKALCFQTPAAQDPSDKRRIPCDVKLKELFDIDCSKTLFRSFCEGLTATRSTNSYMYLPVYRLNKNTIFKFSGCSCGFVVCFLEVGWQDSAAFSNLEFLLV
ncbi:hypothetical protein NC652_018782 [Populus alba x Populus x berolinensis]|uniref:DM2 domain-containing protein n=1 Tax=Populus alba x Populus x berolinensis TaxID=444605 RepID=A0AAD6QGW0_9ROSI|nr:hypothetical protein NC652_018782 [Populus alba x Populus x berolinensis]KAJ6990175.1 hypothetical protein NC653_018650 [Populus alba x Populus x berolinensis]